jgi:hypothetical protein
MSAIKLDTAWDTPYLRRFFVMQWVQTHWELTSEEGAKRQSLWRLAYSACDDLEDIPQYILNGGEINEYPESESDEETAEQEF